eukprot:gene17666-biopygen12832
MMLCPDLILKEWKPLSRNPFGAEIGLPATVRGRPPGPTCGNGIPNSIGTPKHQETPAGGAPAASPRRARIRCFIVSDLPDAPSQEPLKGDKVRPGCGVRILHSAALRPLISGILHRLADRRTFSQNGASKPGHGVRMSRSRWEFPQNSPTLPLIKATLGLPEWRAYEALAGGTGVVISALREERQRGAVELVRVRCHDGTVATFPRRMGPGQARSIWPVRTVRPLRRIRSIGISRDRDIGRVGGSDEAVGLQQSDKWDDPEMHCEFPLRKESPKRLSTLTNRTSLPQQWGQSEQSPMVSGPSSRRAIRPLPQQPWTVREGERVEVRDDRVGKWLAGTVEGFCDGAPLVRPDGCPAPVNKVWDDFSCGGRVGGWAWPGQAGAGQPQCSPALRSAEGKGGGDWDPISDLVLLDMSLSF